MPQIVVNLHEVTTRQNSKAFCQNVNGNVLQIQNEVLGQLQYERNRGIDNFQFYYDEMEKIHENVFEGGIHTITAEAEAVDKFFGSLGVEAEDNYNIVKNNRRYNGIC